MKAVIETYSLSKSYGDKKVVDGLDLKVPEGCVYGFLGPNGAGKSTTMKMILGLTKPTQGDIHVLGKSIGGKDRLEILKNTGSLIEAPSYYGHLSGYENLKIIAALKNVPEAEIKKVLCIVRMENQQDKKAGQYSLGMKQRLGLAAALLGWPNLLLLDEPTNGLDPAGIQEMRELICSLPKEYGMTVLVSSHLLGEIDQMATQAGIISKGQLIFQDSLASLHEHKKPRIYVRTDNNIAALKVLKDSSLPVSLDEDTILLGKSQDSFVSHAVYLLVNAGIGILRLEEKQISLEDIFLNLTGKKVSL